MTPVTDLTLESIQAGGGVWVRWITPEDVDFDHVRILRVLGAGPITGPTDPAATIIFEGRGSLTHDFRPIFRPDPALATGRARQILDLLVVPTQLYTYAVYAANDDATVFSPASVEALTTPDIPVLVEPDVHQLLMDYIDHGLARALASKALKIPKNMAGQISALSVVSALPRLDDTTWPVVSVHLDDDSPSDYALGDVVQAYDLTEGVSLPHLGYLSLLSFSIGGWAADNPVVQRSLYRILKGLLMGARQLLTECGVLKLELTGGYREDMQSYDMPMYSAEFQMKAWVVSRVEYPRPATIEDIDVVSAVSQTAVC